MLVKALCIVQMIIMFSCFKYHIFLVTVLLFILNACKLQEPYNNHGIVNLAKRSDLITINKSNKNDVIKIVGSPHTVSIDNNDEWIYFERVLTKGEFHKLGQNILKSNSTQKKFARASGVVLK